MRRQIITLGLLFILLTAGVPAVSAQESTNTSSSDSPQGEQSAQKNEIMQYVLDDPSNQSVETRRKVVSWLLSPGNMDKLSDSDRDAVRSWLSEATEAGVNIPSRSALTRALENQANSGDSEQEETQYDESCETRIDPSICVTNVTWTDSQVVFTIQADYPHQVTITDSGYIVGVQAGTGSQVPTKSVTVSSGYTRVGMEVTDPRGSPPTVTLSTAGQLYVFKSDGGGGLWAFVRDPSTDLIQYALISGALGAILSLIGSMAYQRYREKHKWYDLADESYVSPPLIRGDPEEDTRSERAKKTLTAHRTKVALLLAGGLYAGAVYTGHAPTPQAFWNDLANRERLILLGTGLASLLSIVPVYAIVSYWRETAYTYVVDVDAEDAVDAELDDADGKVGIYRGTPKLTADMEMEQGQSTDLVTSDGRVKIVREFDPGRNQASGTLSGLHDDREILIEGKSLIHSNREKLENEVEGLRKLLYILPGISIAEENRAARRIAVESEEQMAKFNSGTRNILEDVFDDLEKDYTGEGDVGDPGAGVDEDTDEKPDTPESGE